jgi:beta-lactamase superfamily II metal-dependent hydrolase
MLAALRTTGSRRFLALALAAAIPAAIAGGEVVVWRLQPATAVLLDVGEGQAVLISGPSGRILIDGGPSPARLSAALGEQLAPWEGELASLVVTSPSLAHTGGLAGFERNIGTVVLPAAELPGAGWRSLVAAQAARGARLVRAGAGSRLSIAGFRIEVLAPEPGAPGDEPGAADLALRVSMAGGPAFCDLSDLDPQAVLLAAARLGGRCDYLLVPEEGRSALPPELLRVAQPRQLLVSGAARLARDLPVGNLRRTSQEGSIAVPLR